MHAYRISSSAAPPGALLSTVLVPSSHARGGGGPLSHASSSRTTGSSLPNAATAGHPNTSPPPPDGLDHFHNNDFSLTSNCAGDPGATFNSWDGGADTSNLTFSQVSSGAGRNIFFEDAEKGFPSHDADGAPARDDTTPLLTKGPPRGCGEAAVKCTSTESGNSTLESRPNVGNGRQSISWHPQGLFGAVLQRFQSRGAASHLSTATVSMAGTMLGSEVPEDLPPEPSVSSRRRLSGPSVHAIQFDPDYGGSATPFMSITSPGLSRRSISFPRMSVPQLSAGSMQMSGHSFESESSTQNGAAAEETAGTPAAQQQQQQQPTLPPSTVASPAFNEGTVPAVLLEPPRSTRSPRTFSPTTDSDGAQLASSLRSPSVETMPGGPGRSFHKTNRSIGSRITTNTAAAISDDDEMPLQSRDFLLDAETATATLQSTVVASSLPANSMTDVFDSLLTPHNPQPVLEEQKARAKIEYSEATEFKKLRSLEVSQSLARARNERAAQRRTSKYAGDTFMRQLEAEEREQLHSSMRTRMRTAEAEHQQSMRELREKDRLQPTPPPSSSEGQQLRFTIGVAAKRRASDPPGEARCKRGSQLQQVFPPSSAPALPPLASPLLSSELRLSTPHPPKTNNKNAEVVAEMRRQRELKQRTSLNDNPWKRDETFEKLV